MPKDHLKRYSTPTTWKIKRKGLTFITRPNPGAHPMEFSMPMSSVLKGMLKCAKTTKETKKLLYNNEVLVDGRRVKDHTFPVGLMDVIHLVPTKQHFRIIFDKKGRLTAIEIDKKEAVLKLCRIKGTTLLKGGKIQVNLFDSRNIIVEKGGYKTGDSLLIELPSQKIMENFSLDKGAFVLLLSGKHIADTGVVESIEKGSIVYKNEKGESLTTLKKYAFVVGKGNAAIKIN